jgi:hypothetical protein
MQGSLPLKRDRIYSHVHLLAGKKVPYMNAQNIAKAR